MPIRARWLLATWIVVAAFGGCGDSRSHAPQNATSGSGGSTAGTLGAAGSAGTASGISGGNSHSAGASAGTTSGAAFGGSAPGGASGNGNSSGTGPGGVATSGGVSAHAGSDSGGMEAAGAGNQPATAGAAGAPPTEVSCGFEINGDLSPELATVGLIDWSTDLEGLTAARIEFSLDEPEPDELNVQSGGPISVSGRALLLGLKPARSYTYRIVASAADKFCVSAAQKLSTAPDPDAPVLIRVLADAEVPRAKGFIVTCSSPYALIIDSDGDVVWRAALPMSCSRALMDWDGEYLWAATGNPGPNASGLVSRVRMDGTELEVLPGLEQSHHDFAVLPGGSTAFLVWTQEGDQASDLVERAPDGTFRTLATLGDATLLAYSSLYHANALRYHAADDSFTVSDVNLVGISKLSRQGVLQWQLRTNCAGASLTSCATGDMWGTHGHDLLDNGNLLFFSANYNTRGTGVPSPVYEYGFSQEDGALTATLVWSYESEPGTNNLGDVQRLPNGNTLVTYSLHGGQGIIHEVSPARTLVQSLTGENALGYASFRETLYGPPP